MPGPLTDLGQAIALGARDYASIQREDRLHDRARQEQLVDEARRRNEQLTDESRHRGEQLADRTDSRDYEKQIYDQRRLDAIKNDLIRGGLLDPKAINDPAAIKVALDHAGIDYQRKADELAGYKAMLPKLIEAVGVIDGADKVMSMLPDQVDQARAIVQGAYTKLGLRVDEDRKRGETNKKTAAAMYTVELDNLRKTQSELADIENGVVSTADRLKAFREAAAKLGYPSEDKIPQDRRGDVQAAADKILNDGRLIRGYQLQQSLRETQRRMDNIGDNARTGIYGYIDEAAANGTKPPPATGKTKEASDAEKEAALRALQGDKAPAAAPAANPAALGDGYGGLMGASAALQKAIPASAPMDFAKIASGVGLIEPVTRGLNYLVGGEKRVAEGDAERAGGLVPAMAPASLGGNVDMWNAEIDKQVLGQIAAVQAQLNQAAPGSPEAVQLRTKLNSLQFQLSKPARDSVALGVQ